jgi:hypothetical protein
MNNSYLLFSEKKGEEVLYPTIIKIVIFIIFFSTLLIFVYRSSTGAPVYEQFYAKQIALLIDDAHPNTNITFDFEKGLEIAEENGISRDRIISKINNEVMVKLSDSGEYKFKYFSSANIKFRFDGNNLTIIVS